MARVPTDILATVLLTAVLCLCSGRLLLWLAAEQPVAETPAQHRDVIVRNGDVQLAGTLSLPAPSGAAASPLAVLLSGAGAHDRRGELAGHERLTVLAGALLGAGIATLRLDDRGVGGSTGTLQGSTLDELAGDAVAAVGFAARQPGIDPERVGIVGASEGALVAARAAAGQPEAVAFVVLVSSPASRGDLLFVEQQVDMAEASGVSSAAELRQVRALARRASRVALELSAREQADREAGRASARDDDLRAEARSIVVRLQELLPRRPSLSVDPFYRQERLVDLLLSPLMRSQLAADPAEALRRLRQPVLVLHGSLDRQVPPAELDLVRRGSRRRPQRRDSAVRGPEPSDAAGRDRASEGVCADRGRLGAGGSGDDRTMGQPDDACERRTGRSTAVSTVLSAHSLTRSFGTVRAVDRVDFAAPAGSITGFLGPNGAGKTTTIRLLLGLVQPDSGHACLFDQPIGRAPRAALLSQVGCLIERPRLYRRLTGRQNLRITRVLRDAAAELEPLLELVGLAAAGSQPVAEYSFGMCQRLAIAQALLGQPRLLILDEPMNGLDPAGVRELRLLLRQLVEQRGVSVFVSSHLLAEVDQLADHLIVMNRGVWSSTAIAPRSRSSAGPRSFFRLTDADRAMAALAEQGGSVERLDRHRIAVHAGSDEQVAATVRTLVVAGCDLYAIDARSPSLEELFLTLTGEGIDD